MLCQQCSVSLSLQPISGHSDRSQRPAKLICPWRLSVLALERHAKAAPVNPGFRRRNLKNPLRMAIYLLDTELAEPYLKLLPSAAPFSFVTFCFLSHQVTLGCSLASVFLTNRRSFLASARHASASFGISVIAHRRHLQTQSSSRTNLNRFTVSHIHKWPRLCAGESLSHELASISAALADATSPGTMPDWQLAHT